MYSLFEAIPATDDDVIDLIDLATLKTELGITVDTQDDALQLRITRASGMIAEFCDRIFALTEARETFVFDTGETRATLQLRLYPVRGFASVTVDGTSLAEGDDFEANAEDGIINRIGGTWSGRVVVVYWGGYQLPGDAPASLAAACIEEVRVKRSSAGRDASIREISHGDESVGYFSQPQTTGGLASSAADLVRGFKRLVIA